MTPVPVGTAYLSIWLPTPFGEILAREAERVEWIRARLNPEEFTRAMELARTSTLTLDQAARWASQSFDQFRAAYLAPLPRRRGQGKSWRTKKWRRP